jgi:hypothetical protein
MINSCRKFVWMKICYWKFEGNLNTHVPIWAQQSGEASPTIWPCYANFKSLSLFISSEIDCFHRLWTWKYLHSMTKLSGWLATGATTYGWQTLFLEFKTVQSARTLYVYYAHADLAQKILRWSAGNFGLQVVHAPRKKIIFSCPVWCNKLS